MPNVSERIPLRHVAAQRLLVRLREPLGSDELALAGVDTRAAVALLDRLMEDAPCSAGELSASDRDGLLCALHRHLWGDRIVSSLECEACGAMYDLSFELSALQMQLAAQAEAAAVDAPRLLADSRGRHYRLPDAAQEEAAAQYGMVQGHAHLRALVAGAEQAQANPQELDSRLETLAPLVDVELDANCAECGEPRQARFDVQSFVLQRLLDEREALLDEIHAMAGGYGWPLHDIVSLPRGLRRKLAQRLAGAAAPGAWG
ncbi:hypothetical protein Tamer19_61300 [Cupriavidus sp. TA19]|uniref:hypothetical protein n=1 Tax=unclassified Cupriavidus TaxID=2640874 RepID=UPI000E2EAEE1|nr:MULTISPECIES: hypothetical protein [unclassified Cupriavidus]BDB28717.1 hypothetical protein CTP10_R61280 [Cupriavidus sp. P-10]GLC96721.1 hypothetical protein Tamer19_61300 [Cupriavidus sp. TA19]